MIILKIAYHHRTSGKGAAGIHIKEIVRAFNRLGHETTVISLTGKRNNNQKVKTNNKFNNINKFILKLLKKIFVIIYNFPGYFYLLFKSKKRKVDFIYERYSLYNYVGILVSQRLNIPLVLEVNAPFAHETEEHEQPPFPKLAKKIEINIFEKADLIIVISKSLKNYLEKLGIAPNKIFIMHNGVNFEKFNWKVSKKKVINKYKNNNKTVVGFVGGLEPHHGLKLLFNAVNKLKEKDKVVLLIVGDGSYRNELEQLSNKLGIKSVFTGEISHEEVPKYISAMDITVKPDANPYCSPMKIFEYMAMKKPILACKTKSVEEIITNGFNGVLVNPNSNSIKEGLENLIHEKKLRNEISENGYKYVKEKFSWEKNAEKVIELVQDI